MSQPSDDAITTAPPSGDTVPPNPPAPIYTFRLGGMRTERSKVEVSDLTAFLNQAHDQDTVAEYVEGPPLYLLDADTHSWTKKPTDEYLAATAASMTPSADYWFISHGKGLKFIFIDKQARARALCAALSMPVDFALEIAQQFRHPRSFSTKHQGEAGQLHHHPAASAESFTFLRTGAPRPEVVAELLAQRHMTLGGRFDHALCPIAGHLPSDAGACVVAGTTGIYCFRCAAKGLCFDGVRKPGVVPYFALVPGTQSFLADLTSNLVHAEHARHEIAYRLPNLGPTLREEVFRLALEDIHGIDDPRIPMVFSRKLKLIYSIGGWVDAKTLKPVEVNNDILDFMPGVNYVHTTEKGDVVAMVDRPSRWAYGNTLPDGYNPIRPYRGILLSAHPGTIPLEAPPKLRYPVRLLDQPLPLDETLAGFQGSFPGIHPTYLQGAIGAAVCADVGGGPPSGLTGTGPSGSGKEGTIAVAASCMGDSIVKVQLDTNAEAFMRQIGSSTAGGSRFLMFDELGKQAGLSKKWASILQIGSTIQYRPLYGQSLVSVPCRSAFFYPCVLFPDWLRSSPEFRRRTRGVHLPSKTPNWTATCGGDIADWRGRSTRNALLCNSLLTHVYRLCSESNFIFDNAPGCVADRLGLGSIGDGAEGIDPEHMRNLFRYARGQLGERVFFEKDLSFSKGWLDLTAPNAVSLISVFADGDENDTRALRRAVQTNLMAASWNDTLGIASPPITIDVKIHGSRWGMRLDIPGRPGTGC